jgi:uncharacterized protein
VSAEDGRPGDPGHGAAPATPTGTPADAAGGAAGAAVSVDRRLLEFLVCPVTRGRLVYDAERQELVSQGANRAYPIQNGIPIMLIDEARLLDE